MERWRTKRRISQDRVRARREVQAASANQSKPSRKTDQRLCERISMASAEGKWHFYKAGNHRWESSGAQSVYTYIYIYVYCHDHVLLAAELQQLFRIGIKQNAGK